MNTTETALTFFLDCAGVALDNNKAHQYRYWMGLFYNLSETGIVAPVIRCDDVLIPLN